MISSLSRPALLASLALLSSLGLGGCYQERCEILPAAEEGVLLSELRNPETGQCESFGSGGGGGSSTTCGDYGGAAPEPGYDRAPLPDWGVCNGFCEALGEEDCLAAAECRGAYLSGCPDGDAACDPEAPQFYQCWATSTGTPSPGECEGLWADECARHNDCIAVHNTGADGGIGFFAYCAPEGEGPIDPGSCVEEVACDAEPPACPEGTVPGRRGGCWTGYCIPLEQCDATPACTSLEEASCVSRGDCSPVYEGVDCSCSGDSCTCADWIYSYCE